MEVRESFGMIREISSNVRRCSSPFVGAEARRLDSTLSRITCGRRSAPRAGATSTSLGVGFRRGVFLEQIFVEQSVRSLAIEERSSAEAAGAKTLAVDFVVRGKRKPRAFEMRLAEKRR